MARLKLKLSPKRKVSVEREKTLTPKERRIEEIKRQMKKRLV